MIFIYVNQDFFYNNFPKFNSLIQEFFSELIESKYKKDLQENFVNQMFRIAEDSIRTFNSNIEKDLKIENQLISNYENILATAMIPVTKGENI